MKFGKVEDPSGIDFTLPKDHPGTIKVLGTKGKPNIYIGCAKWNKADLKSFYPKGTKDELAYYATQFNSIELNATFYNSYPAETIAKWKQKADVRPDFKFCPKFSQSISHIRRLKNAEEATTKFYEGILAFGDKLGPLFLQLSDNFTPKSFPELKAYLEQLPTDVPVYVELRHKDWFAVPENRDNVFNLLKQLNIGAVITDATGRRDCVHMELPTPHAFIRFVGNGLHPSDYARVDEWIDRIKLWRDMGLQSVWFFMHQHDERYSPKLADYVSEQFNIKLGLNLERPHFIEDSKGLFG